MIKAGTMADLTAHDRKMLDVVDQWHRHGGSIINVIIGELGMRPVPFFQRLAALIDTPEAAAYRPVLVARLRRLQSRRGRAEVMRRGAAQT
jgi:hypothetical protein